MSGGYKVAFITKITDGPRASTQPRDKLGSIRRVGNKTYKYVMLRATAQSTVGADSAANGDAMAYDDYSAHSVVIDIDDMEANMPAGIVVNFANWDGDMSEAQSSYMWIQIGGPATVSTTIAASAAAGDRFDLSSASAADKTFTLHAPTHTAGNDTVPCGVMIAGKEVYLDCPF